VAARSSHIRNLFALVRFAEQGDVEAIEILREACSKSGQYLGTVLAIVQPKLSSIL
jgi:N-acetylglucosamine kinase-like BadF-type ATPase